MSNAIDQMIANAENRSTEVATTTQQPTQLQTYQPQQSRAPSLDDLSTSSIIVDGYLKVKEFGLVVSDGKKEVLISNLLVNIDQKEVVATTVIKMGNPATYYKTFNGITCADGATTWAEAIERGARFNPPATPYASADIPMTLLEDVKANDGSIIYEKGQRLGYSLSTTNKAAFAKYRQQLGGLDLLNDVVETRLGYEKRTNKANNTWGIVTFEALGRADEAGE